MSRKTGEFIMDIAKQIMTKFLFDVLKEKIKECDFDDGEEILKIISAREEEFLKNLKNGENFDNLKETLAKGLTEDLDKRLNKKAHEIESNDIGAVHVKNLGFYPEDIMKKIDGDEWINLTKCTQGVIKNFVPFKAEVKYTKNKRSRLIMTFNVEDNQNNKDKSDDIDFEHKYGTKYDGQTLDKCPEDIKKVAREAVKRCKYNICDVVTFAERESVYTVEEYNYIQNEKAVVYGLKLIGITEKGHDICKQKGVSPKDRYKETVLADEHKLILYIPEKIKKYKAKFYDSVKDDTFTSSEYFSDEKQAKIFAQSNDVIFVALLKNTEKEFLEVPETNIQ
jgi:hypothetical protein